MRIGSLFHNVGPVSNKLDCSELRCHVLGILNAHLTAYIYDVVSSRVYFFIKHNIYLPINKCCGRNYDDQTDELN